MTWTRRELLGNFRNDAAALLNEAMDQLSAASPGQGGTILILQDVDIYTTVRPRACVTINFLNNHVQIRRNVSFVALEPAEVGGPLDNAHVLNALVHPFLHQTAPLLAVLPIDTWQGTVMNSTFENVHILATASQDPDSATATGILIENIGDKSPASSRISFEHISMAAVGRMIHFLRDFATDTIPTENDNTGTTWLLSDDLRKVGWDHDYLFRSIRGANIRQILVMERGSEPASTSDAQRPRNATFLLISGGISAYGTGTILVDGDRHHFEHIALTYANDDFTPVPPNLTISTTSALVILSTPEIATLDDNSPPYWATTIEAPCTFRTLEDQVCTS